jgi:hypothetical protein
MFKALVDILRAGVREAKCIVNNSDLGREHSS